MGQKIFLKRSFEDLFTSGGITQNFHQLLDFTSGEVAAAAVSSGIVTVDNTITWYNAGDISASGGLRCVYVIAVKNQNIAATGIPVANVGDPLPVMRLINVECNYWPTDGSGGCGGVITCGGIQSQNFLRVGSPGHENQYIPLDDVDVPGSFYSTHNYQNANILTLFLDRGTQQGVGAQTVFTLTDITVEKVS